MVLVSQSITMGAANSSSSLSGTPVNAVGILENDHVEQIYLDVSVMNPITLKGPDGRLVTTYAIYIETNDSAFTMSRSMVRRRYSDFMILRSILHEQHPSVSVPQLPSKTFLGKRFDQRFIQDRCSGLQDFLKAVVDQPVYLSNKSLHLFLQTSLSMKQVQNVVNGCESFELPHNNSPTLLLYPVDTKLPSSGDRVGILKREISSSLATCAEHECQVRTKHEHMRVGSGILVCPYAIVPGKEGPANIRHMAGSAPFWVPGGSPKAVANVMRSCASDTCLDGGASGSPAGSKKRVSFFIDKEDKRSLLRRVEAAHGQQANCKDQQNAEAVRSGNGSSAQTIPTNKAVEEHHGERKQESSSESDSSSAGSVASDSNVFGGCDDIEVIAGVEVNSKFSAFTDLVAETVTAEEVIGC